MKTRLYFMDKLRTFMIFLVVLLHAGIVYEPILEGIWIVSDPDKHSSIGLIRMYLDLFIMFTLFYISGYFIPYSVKSKNAWGFLKSKFKRLLVPWIIAVLTLIPIYKAIFLFSRGLPQEEWITYFHFFQRAGGDLSNFADNPMQSWLWFLPVLFIFQVLYMLLSKANLLNFKISIKTGVALTFLIGLIYSLIISTTGLLGWHHSALLHFQNERLLIYFMAFLLGTLSNKLKVFESGKKNMKLYIWSNVVLTIALGLFTATALNLFFNMIEPGRNYFFVSSTVDRIAYYATALLSMLSILYVLIHVFRFSFNKTGKLASEMSKNSYHVYIIHIIVLGLIALIMLDMPIPAFFKFIVLTITTFVISNVIVSGYRGILQKPVTTKSITAAALIAILVTSAYSINNRNESNTPKASSTDATATSIATITATSVPAIGLHEAALTGNLEAVKQHINAGSDLNEKELSRESSPLITAATFGKTDVVRALIEGEADVNYQNKDGSTALHAAAFFCNTEVVEVLLENGSDKNIRNNDGATAFESVTGPFEDVKPIYDYFRNMFGPLGLKLDEETIKTTRPEIAEILK